MYMYLHERFKAIEKSDILGDICSSQPSSLSRETNTDLFDSVWFIAICAKYTIHTAE